MLSPSDENIAWAARALREGGLVAFPTETVYGLGANARDGHAVARVYEAKARPQFNPLIVHVSDLGHAERLGVFDDRARILAQQFWPGPLTLVVPLASDSGLSSLVSAGLETVGLRVPSHPVTQKLIGFARVPVAAPSANKAGQISPTTAEHVARDFDDTDGFIINGGRCPGGLESTVVGLAGERPVLLRPGGLAREAIEARLGTSLQREEEEAGSPAAPGMMKSHYAPRARLRLNAREARSGEVLLGFGPDAPDEAILNLSETGDLGEAAANLFGYLRALDACGTDIIAVNPVPCEGLGETINDRLEKAAAPRRGNS